MTGKHFPSGDGAPSPERHRAIPAGWSWATIAKMVRFGIVAAVSCAIYLVVTALLVAKLDVDARLASTLGYVAAMPFNFVAHRQYTFLSDGVIWHEVLRYCTVHAANILASVGLMAVIVNGFGLSYWLGMAGTIALVPLIQFLMMNFWVFRDQARARVASNEKSRG